MIIIFTKNINYCIIQIIHNLTNVLIFLLCVKTVFENTSIKASDSKFNLVRTMGSQ